MTQVKEGYSLTHAFRFFRKEYKHKSPVYESISQNTYRNVCKDFNKMLAQEVLDGGSGTRLPFSLGILWIKKMEVNFKKPRVDWVTSQKLGKTVYFVNHHSDNLFAGWRWSRKKNLIRNIIYYSFKPTFTNKRAIAGIMKSPGGHKRFYREQTYTI